MNYEGTASWPARLSLAHVVLHLDGPWPVLLRTHAVWPPHPQTRWTLRCRTQTAVTVQVERRLHGRWVVLLERVGYEWGTLVKPQGAPVRLVVRGESPGWVQVIETRN